MRTGPHPIRRVVFVALVSAAFLPLPAPAQDLFEAGRRHGTVPTGPLARRALGDPTVFEFRRAWRNKTAAVRARREALERRDGPQLSAEQIQAAGAAVTGTMRVPVIAGVYSDTTAAFATSVYQERLFGDGASRYTAKSYYREVSRNLFTMDGTVSAWVQLPEVAAFYNPSSATDPTVGRVGQFLVHALQGADPGMNFGQFDNDGPDGVPNSGDDDGYVDAAAFIYPTHGRECGGPGIWAHRWTVGSASGQPFVTNDPRPGGGFIRVDDYLILGGVGCDGTSLMEIGTFAHEMGHALGLPDLYDTDGAAGGSSQGVGEWDLMGSGNYLSPSSPAHMGAWSKDFLGWLNVETITATRLAAALPTVYAAGVVWRYDIPASNEYFLLEHRNQSLSDANLHGPGLLVWHIDHGVVNDLLPSNRVNGTASRQGVDLMEADGLNHLGNNNNRGDGGDPFPGTSAITAFLLGTNPSSNSNDGQASGLELTNVALNGGQLAFDLKVGAVMLMNRLVRMTVQPGGTASHSLSVTMAGGVNDVVTFSSSASWLTVEPGTGTTPTTVALRADAAGLPVQEQPHYAEVTVTSPSAQNSGQVVLVELRVGAGAMAIGDSLAAALGSATERDTVQLNLVAGQAVDIGVFSRSGNADFYPGVALLDPSGGTILATSVPRNGPNGRIIPRYTAGVAGTYRVVIRSAGPAPFSGPQDYIVRTRPSGAVLGSTTGVIWHFDPHGATTARLDTILVANFGSGSGTFTAVAGAPWIAVSGGGTAQGGAVPPAGPAAVGSTLVDGADLSARPSDGPLAVGPAVPVVVTTNPAGMALGGHMGEVTLRFPNDVWNGEVSVPIYMRLHDSRSVTINTTVPVPSRIAVGPDGVLAVGSDREIYRVNPTSGAATPWVTGVRAEGLEFGADSLLYVADGNNNRVVRVAADGTVQPLFSTAAPANDVAVLSDGTVYASTGTRLVRWRPGESAATEIARTTSRPRFALSIAYHQGWIYFGEANRFRRVGVWTGEEQDLAALPATANSTLLNLSVGASGRLYGTENNLNGAVLVLNGTGTIRNRIYGGAVGFGLAIGDNALFGTGYLWDEVWRLPLNDGPAQRDVLMGDASGDGQITVADALGVLSQVVGRPVPSGWVPSAGDANCDGETTAFDVLVILSDIVGKDVSAFCVGNRW